MTPEEVAWKTIHGETQTGDEFIKTASADELFRFFYKAIDMQSTFWVERAKIALQIRLARDSVELTNELIKHTEKLTQQTEIHIQHTENLAKQNKLLVEQSVILSQQNAILVSESRKLGRLTWALIALTAVLLAATIGLLLIDWHRKV